MTREARETIPPITFASYTRLRNMLSLVASPARAASAHGSSGLGEDFPASSIASALAARLLRPPSATVAPLRDTGEMFGKRSIDGRLAGLGGLFL